MKKSFFADMTNVIVKSNETGGTVQHHFPGRNRVLVAHLAPGRVGIEVYGGAVRASFAHATGLESDGPAENVKYYG